MSALYHVWFATRDRRPLLDAEIAPEVRSLLLAAAKRDRLPVLEAEPAFAELHLLLSIDDGQDLGAIVDTLKEAGSGGSSTPIEWQHGFGCRRIAPAELQTLRYYFFQLRPPLYR